MGAMRDDDHADHPYDPRRRGCNGAHPGPAVLRFPADRPAPRYIRYLGNALPGAIFGLLVVYCLRSVDVLTGTHGIPEALGILVAGGLYLWRKNMLVAIFASTALYMVLVNLVFV